jgi:hypothetical protein
MPFEDFRARHGECFEREAGEFRLLVADGKDRPVESWAVSAAADCRERYAALLESRVLVADGAVVAVGRVSAREEKVAARRVERQVELVPIAGGGFGVRGADGKVEPIPPDAEVRTLDGKPLPPSAGEGRP